MMRAARADANQPEIVKAFRKMGAYVLLTHQLKNCCDCIIVYQGTTVAVEIKDDQKPPSQRKLTEGEEKFMQGWSAAGGKWAKIENVEEAKGLLGSIFEHKRNR